MAFSHEGEPFSEGLNMRRILVGVLLYSLGLLAPRLAEAALNVPSFFSDSMVLQRDCDVAIWGTADAGADVRVDFKDSTATTMADASGHWRVMLASGPADATGHELTITSGASREVIGDVLVGEVWLASGQSNMVFSMNRVPDYAEILAEADFPQIRMFNAPTVTAVEPQADIEASWAVCSPETAPQYSAVAFFFARKLHRELGVPVGVIKTAWGGKPVETFTSREALQSLPATADLVERAIAADSSYDPAQARQQYEARLAAWEKAEAAWKAKPEGGRGNRPRRPTVPKRPLDTEGQPGVLFNSMIHPFVGYTLRGAIWYQGEANAKAGAVPYDQTLPLLIRDWRSRWGNDMPFYFVQLANFRQPTLEPGDSDPWPLLQDRMRRILLTTPKTGMAVINDVGEAGDIHPKNKHDVGERLALWALAQDYGRDLIFSGPLMRSYEVQGDRIAVAFDHVGGGLVSRDGAALGRFEIAGSDRTWRWADAEIVGKDVVVVSHPQVAKPVAVRYAWAANPAGANLVNSARLPASVFRTDDWDDVEAP